MLNKKILFIHHSPSINTKQLSDCVVKKINKLKLKISLKSVTPLDVNFHSFNSVNGVIIGTTENFGYMAGLTKDFLIEIMIYLEKLLRAFLFFIM